MEESGKNDWRWHTLAEDDKGWWKIFGVGEQKLLIIDRGRKYLVIAKDV